ncbi:hypothetical protein ES703_96797 [subsurface metagenome]
MRTNTIDIPKETLEHLYWDERLSIKAIAEKLGLSITPVYRSMERHNVRRRTDAEIKKLERGKLNISREQLEDLYIKQELPIIFIATQLDINPHTTRKLLDDYTIPIRSRSEIQRISAPKRLLGKDGHGRNWRGGYTRNSQGYILKHTPEHPRANTSGYVYEHILVWEQTYGKPLPKGWVTHHLNGIRDDNLPQNLTAMSNRTHRNLEKVHQVRIRQLETELKELQQLKLTVARG